MIRPLFIFLFLIFSLYIIIEIALSKERVRLKNEFKRGLMLGVDYHRKYDEFPSYWMWDIIYEQPNINLDSLKKANDSMVGDIIYLQKPIVSIHDTVYIESIGKPEPNGISIKTKPTKRKRHAIEGNPLPSRTFIPCIGCDTIYVNSPTLYIDSTTIKGKRILKLAK